MDTKGKLLAAAVVITAVLYMLTGGNFDLQSISIGQTLYAQMDSEGTFGPASEWWVADLSMRTGENNILMYSFTPEGESEAAPAYLRVLSTPSECRYSLLNRNANYQGVGGIIYYELGTPKRNMPIVATVNKGTYNKTVFINAANVADRAEFEISDPKDGVGRLIIMPEGLHMSETDCASSNNIVVLIKDDNTVVIADRTRFETALPLLTLCEAACHPASGGISQVCTSVNFIESWTGINFNPCRGWKKQVLDAPKPASWSETPVQMTYNSKTREVSYIHSHGTGQLRIYANADFFDMEPVAGETAALAPKINSVTAETVQEKASIYVRASITNPATYPQSIAVRGEAQGGTFGVTQNYAFEAGETKTVSILFAAPATDGDETLTNKLRACVSNVLSEACDEETFQQRVTQLPDPLPIIGECSADYARNPGNAYWDDEECIWICNQGYSAVYDESMGKNICQPDGTKTEEGISWEMLAVAGAVVLAAGAYFFKGRK
ncbi:MAG: hypothetical protein WC350_05915 [Candidatus Micrarchaeia archaeon]|jgi:hypothetical protein